MKKYEVLFADLDGTLIDTVSVYTFPRGVWDMKLKFDVLDAIKKLQPKYIFVVSNQGGIERGYVDRSNFESKMRYIRSALQEYTGASIVSYQYCPSNDAWNENRKPNTGMLSMCIMGYGVYQEENYKEKCLMIGDASGLEGQFSDSDKKTAENYGIDYMDVAEFVAAMKE